MADLLLSSGASDTGGGDLDERVVAQAALDAAEEQLQSLCASHAGTFVSVERRGRATEEALRDLQNVIKAAEERVINAQNALDQDEDKETSLAVLAEKHRVRRRTLLQHSSLLELLELPSLMDACVRSSLYEEALSIAASSNSLERRHKDSNAVVTRVIQQIRSRQVDLRRHLLHRLKSPVTMPQCLEVVTALRRLNSIDLERQKEIRNLEQVHEAMELRLQVDFLEARDAWLDSAPNTNASTVTIGGGAAPRPSLGPVQPAEQLLDAIERYRTRVFEVATQFNAIFRAQAASSQSASSISLLGMWTARRVNSFLGLLALQLAATDDSTALRDALEASVFFASSMGRLGADFTPQLEPLFAVRMHALVTRSWTDGAQHLSETLKVCREAGVASPLTSHTNTDTAATAATTTGPGGETAAPLDGPQPPPRQLLALPPLARFVNSILTGLNELRRCLLPGIFSELRTSLDGVLQTVRSELVSNERAVLTPGLRGEAAALRETAARFQVVFAEIVEPYVRGSLEAALGNSEGAVHFHTVLRENEKEPEPEPEEEKEEEKVDEEQQEKEGGEETAEDNEIKHEEPEGEAQDGTSALETNQEETEGEPLDGTPSTALDHKEEEAEQQQHPE